MSDRIADFATRMRLLYGVEDLGHLADPFCQHILADDCWDEAEPVERLDRSAHVATCPQCRNHAESNLMSGETQ